LDVATGAKFLGRFQCAKRKVLYVDYENRPYRLQERVRDMIGENIPPDVTFYALNRLSDREVGLRKDEEYEALQEIVHGIKPGLLVIDPLRYAVSGDLDEPTSLKILDNVSRLKEINPDMATVLVHHTKKSQGEATAVKLKADPRNWVDKVYGSQALLAHVETIWGLEKEDDSYSFATVPRSQAGLNLVLTKEGISERFVFDSESKQEFTDAQKQAWQKLPQSFTWGQAIKSGIAPSTLSRTLERGTSSGLLRQDRETKQYQKLPDSLEQWNNADNMGVQ
jgi:hypothetical protein